MNQVRLIDSDNCQDGASNAFAATTGADVLAAGLRRHGVTHVFGQSIPAAFFVVAHHYGIRQIGYRTESAGGAMADAYARVTGKVGVVAAQNGPAATLLVAPLAEALKASVPIVAIVQDVPTSMTDRNAFQEFDHLGLFQSCAKWVKRLTEVSRLDDYIDQAFTAAASGRPGPAVLILPMDLLRKAAVSNTARTSNLGGYPLDRFAPSADAISNAARLLIAAKRPIIVAGGGVHLSGATASLNELSDLCGIPVATTNMGKGSVDETGALSLGVFGNCMGPGTPGHELGYFLTDADVVVLVGTRTNQNGTDSWKAVPTGATIIHIDIDPMELGRNYDCVRLLGDARLTLAALVDELRHHDFSANVEHRAAVTKQIEQSGPLVVAARTAIGVGRKGALRPEALMAELNKILKPDDIVVADASYSTNWVTSFLTSRRAGSRFLTPRGLAGLGWGFPMALGAKVGAPGARVFAIEGDGGFGHCWSELETARRMNIPVVLIVLNNSILGYELHAEHVHYGVHTDACRFASVDHAAIARATGCWAETVDSPEHLAGAIQRALAAGVPAVLDVMIDPNAFPPLSLFGGDINPGSDEFLEVGGLS
ncbi:acetolactate synthase catalytic subunit (plasmid) [Pseudomonas sp. App30]|uniref:acetolactate synthase catalytic subunit n=1 Tax=Pseudomonas sp. App30 TaxID=3068990 RepID=UPI003A7F768E